MLVPHPNLQPSAFAPPRLRHLSPFCSTHTSQGKTGLSPMWPWAGLAGTAMPCHLEARQTFLFLSVRGVCSVINRVSDALSFRGQQRFDRLTDVPGNRCRHPSLANNGQTRCQPGRGKRLAINCSQGNWDLARTSQDQLGPHHPNPWPWRDGDLLFPLAPHARSLM